MNEAELLFSEVLGCDRASLYLNRDRYLDKKELGFIASALRRRGKGEPIQYILGKTEFMGLELKVNKSVLIPRPETEILVETTLESARRLNGKPLRQLKVLDLGTGSGCIAVSLAKYSTDLKIDASDISAGALAVARKNAGFNNAKVSFIQSDLFKGINERYDIIVSNPPYIVESQLGKLQPELEFEPEIALNGGRDGLDFYRRIILTSPDYLNEGGVLILEMGFNQAASLKKIFSVSGRFRIMQIVKDYSHIDRVIVARKADSNG